VPPQRQRRPVDAVTLHNCRQTTLHHARRRPMGIGTRSLHVRGGAVLIAGLIVTPLPTPPGELGLALAMRGQSSAFFALQSAPTREKMGNRRNLRGIATLQQGTRPRRPIIPFFPQFPRSSLQETLAAGTRYIHYPAQTFAPARRRGIHNASTTPCKQEAVTAPAREGTDDTPTSLPLPQTTTLRITRQDCRCQASPAVFLPWRPINPRPIDWMLDHQGDIGIDEWSVWIWEFGSVFHSNMRSVSRSGRPAPAAPRCLLRGTRVISRHPRLDRHPENPIDESV
jgi:hypothetical protein